MTWTKTYTYLAYWGTKDQLFTFALYSEIPKNDASVQWMIKEKTSRYSISASIIKEWIQAEGPVCARRLEINQTNKRKQRSSREVILTHLPNFPLCYLSVESFKSALIVYWPLQAWVQRNIYLRQKDFLIPLLNGTPPYLCYGQLHSLFYKQCDTEEVTQPFFACLFIFIMGIAMSIS